MTADPSGLTPRVPISVAVVRDNRPYTRYMNEAPYHLAVDHIETWIEDFGFTQEDLCNIVALALRKNLERKARR